MLKKEPKKTSFGWLTQQLQLAAAGSQPEMSATEAQLGLESQPKLECALESDVEYGFQLEFEFE